MLITFERENIIRLVFDNLFSYFFVTARASVMTICPLAKYAGLFRKQHRSGDYEAADTKLSKEGNRYLRYYLVEAANSAKNHNSLYNDFYLKKHGEVTKHQHKRTLSLTAGKLIRSG